MLASGRIKMFGRPGSLSSLSLLAGAGGMVVSLLFLASSSHLDVLAGAAGFVAGSVLAAAGIVALAILGRSPATGADSAPPLGRWAAFAAPGFAARWLAHFRRNRVNRPEPDWHAPIAVPADARRPLVRSLEQFQLGDGGGPACLIAWNADRLRSSSEAARALVDLWFAEEREHSRLLGAALARFGGQCIAGHWSFTVFCLVRKCLGVRFELTALLLTEIVSTAYYRLLRNHGQDPALRAMCRLILRDEAGHIAFHRDRLARSRRARYGKFWEARFRVLGLAAGSMLWVNHAPALRALGASRGEFYHEIWIELSRFVRQLRCDTAKYAEANAAEVTAKREVGMFGAV
jgi:hypothetical protein